jgi:LysM repeat protein
MGTGESRFDDSRRVHRAMLNRFAVTTLLAGTLLLLASLASAVELAPDAPHTYTVRSGDTLWDIAGRFLRDPWRWPEVWQANAGLDDPDLIYPGDVLQLTMADGQPRIGVVRGGAAAGARDGMRVVRLSPQVRASPLKDAVPTIGIASIAPFLTQPYVADTDQIERAAYVVGFPDEHLVAGLNDSVYVRRIDSNAQTNFQILRPGDALRDPETNEILGYEALFVATAKLERVGDPAKLRVVRAEREVAIGDRVIPANTERPLENFQPRPAPRGTKGRILSVLNGVSQIGQFDVVVINRGTRDRIELGHVFAAFIGGSRERDQVRDGSVVSNWRGESPLSTEFWYGRNVEKKGWREDDSFPLHADFRRKNTQYVKPFERAGTLMVFRTFELVSFALVLDAQRAFTIGDQVAPPAP